MTPAVFAAPALVQNWHPVVDVLPASRQNQDSEVVQPWRRECRPSRAFWLHVGATPGTRGLHTLPWPTARRPIASSGDRTLRRTAVTSDSPAARARILARSRTRSRVGGQASGAYHEGRTATTSVSLISPGAVE